MRVRGLPGWLLPAALLASALAPTARAQTATEATYAVRYDVLVVPSERVARVSVRIPAHGGLVRSIHWRIDPKRHLDLESPSGLERVENVVTWNPPPRDAVLRYSFRIDQLRDEASYDARCSDHWALFRGDDLVPPARVISQKGSRSEARLRLRLPARWSAATPFERVDDGRYAFDDPTRRFDRPTGWLVMGRIGVLRERVAGTRLAIAGPVGQGFRRHDILALMRWTLPVLRDVVGELPPRLLIVGADDPMWRGGLSGPRSVYVHADRPLISSDATSTILHEIVHAVMRARSGEGGDWITEGLAELYSIEMLARSKTVSRRRYEKALRELRERGDKASRLDGARVAGDVTARAITVLRALDREIRDATGGEAGLDEVMRRLASEAEPITPARLRTYAEEIADRDLGAFFRFHVGGASAGSRAGGG